MLGDPFAQKKMVNARVIMAVFLSLSASFALDFAIYFNYSRGSVENA